MILFRERLVPRSHGFQSPAIYFHLFTLRALKLRLGKTLCCIHVMIRNCIRSVDLQWVPYCFKNLALVQGSQISCLQPSEPAWYDWSLDPRLRLGAALRAAAASVGTRLVLQKPSLVSIMAPQHMGFVEGCVSCVRIMGNVSTCLSVEVHVCVLFSVLCRVCYLFTCA